MGQYKIPPVEEKHLNELRDINHVIKITTADLEARAVKRIERVLTDRIAERFQRVINELDYLRERFIEKTIEKGNQETEDEEDGT